MSTNSIEDNQAEIIADFAQMGDDWQKKYTYLIKLGRTLPPMNPHHKSQENLISGCQSRIWLYQYPKEGKQYYEVECDAAIIKGIAALLIKIYSGNTPAAIMSAKLYCLEEIGLHKHLSPQRANGLAGMVQQMKSRLPIHE